MVYAMREISVMITFLINIVSFRFVMSNEIFLYCYLFGSVRLFGKMIVFRLLVSDDFR